MHPSPSLRREIIKKLKPSVRTVLSKPPSAPTYLLQRNPITRSRIKNARRPPAPPPSTTYRIPRLAEDIHILKTTHVYSPWPPARSGQLAVNPSVRLPDPHAGTAPAHIPSDYRNTMLAHVDVISTPSVDTPGACLRLHFDNRHYIFGNVSEGTQRIMASKRMSMAKVEDIFLSGPVDWHATGGMLGFLLTIADVHETVLNALTEVNLKKKKKKKKEEARGKQTLDHVNIHGAKNLAHMLASARRFVWRKAFPLVPLEIRRDPRADRPEEDMPDWADENIKVWYVPVQSAAAVAAQPSKFKKRKAEQMSDSDGETAPAPAKKSRSSTGTAVEPISPNQEDVDQMLRLGVVEKMFNSKGGRYVRTKDHPVVELREVKQKYMTTSDANRGVYTRDENGGIQPYSGSGKDAGEVLIPDGHWKAADVKHLPPVERSSMSMCYVVKITPGKGKFNAARAVELGVKKQDYKLLVDGQTVLAQDGSEVTPDMVVGPAPEATGFALVELPDASYIDDLLSRPEWKNEKIMSGLAAMYWIARAPDVLKDERILRFMRERPGMTHTVLSRTKQGIPCLIGKSAIELKRLQMVAGDLFHSVVHVDGDAAAVAAPSDTALPYEVGLAGAQLRLKPKILAVEDSLVRHVTEAEIMETLNADPEIVRLADEAKAKVADPTFLAAVAEATADLPNRDAEVIPLGTGSALPSRLRNVSCTLVRVPGVGTYMLDCGENTLGQLRRMYGFEGADDVLRDLKAIWISHSHADHHLGTISVLKRFSEVVALSTGSDSPQQKVALIAHPFYHHFLAEYAQAEPIGLDTHVELISNTTAVEAPSATNAFARGLFRPIDDPTILAPFGLSRVAICRVDHCDDARAVALTLASSGLKIAYSGDCRPSRDFAADRVGGGAHLLIHEATLDDELQADAVAKKHCTISEALRVAREMRAKNVLLTHFSQRYPRLPEVKNAGGADGDAAPVVFAFDFMRVRLGEFRIAREFIGALQRLYADEVVEDKSEEPVKVAMPEGPVKGEKPREDGKGKTKQQGLEPEARHKMDLSAEEVIQRVEEKVMEEKTADV